MHVLIFREQDRGKSYTEVGVWLGPEDGAREKLGVMKIANHLLADLYGTETEVLAQFKRRERADR